MTRDCTRTERAGFPLGTAVIALLVVNLLSTEAGAQVRTKKPDRSAVDSSGRAVESLQSVTIRAVEPASRNSIADDVDHGARFALDNGLQPVSNLEMVDLGPVPTHQSHPASSPIPSMVRGSTGSVSARSDGETDVRQTNAVDSIKPSTYIPFDPACGIEEATCGIESMVPGCVDHCGVVGCDGACGMGCDYGGCDGLSSPCVPASWRAGLSFDPCRWFGELEILLLWRKGDLIRPLITTGPEADGADAGALNQADTDVLAGDEKMFDQVTAGGRLTLGTWLDHCQDRSLVFRLWSATEEDFGSRATDGIISVPFFNTVPDTETVNLIQFPDGVNDAGGDPLLLGRFGTASVSATSNFYGGDVSIRQLWTGGLGTRWDVFYGYQYLRLDEDLQLSTRSTQTEDVLTGTTAVVDDRFQTTSEFHGGQLGLQGNYREGCWSFDLLFKLGFGQLRREAERTGRTVIDNGIPPASVTDEGLLVRASNSGTQTDHTFGWVPELDLSLGWHRYPRFDVTVGYYLIAVSDALRVSGAMDPLGRVNTAFPVGDALPTPGFRYETFYAQGIQFGLKHVY
ncbi:MAG: BBP7 family outer membrane beta-barrel protein [Planctomycetota bacterium]